MSFIKKILIVIAMLGLVVCGVIVYNIVQTFSSPNTAFNNAEAYVYIPSKTDDFSMKDELFPLVKDEVSFKLVATKLGLNNTIKSGKHTLQKNMSNIEIVKTLQAESELVTVVIPDTKNREVIAQQVSNQIEAKKKDVLLVLNDSVFMREHKVQSAELFAAGSYQMPWNITAEAFRDRMFTLYKSNKK